VYLAHSGVALTATGADRRVSLLWLLVAAWAFDITGVGHWLPFAVALALAAYELGRRRWDARVGALLALVVASHDGLDLVVGVQLWPGGRYIGWDLGHGSGLELALELAVLAVGSAVYLGGLPPAARRRPLVVVAFTSLVVTTVGRYFAVASSNDDDVAPAILLAMAVGALVTSVLLVRADRGARGASVRSR